MLLISNRPKDTRVCCMLSSIQQYLTSYKLLTYKAKKKTMKKTLTRGKVLAAIAIYI
jgi:hypothetical protein